MITPKDIENKSMTPEKRQFAKNDIIAFYIGRPISYVFTIPFLYTNIKPDTISLISILFNIAGFFVLCFADNRIHLMIGFLMFALWSLCDGIDGNIARYKKQFSKMGSVYDAMGGYVCMALQFLGCGVAASHLGGMLKDSLPLKPEIYIILGALSSMSMIFPRLIMHKAITTVGKDGKVDSFQDRGSYGFIKTVILNITSIAGGAHALLFYAALLNAMDIYTIFYFVVNFVVMIGSIVSIFKDNR